MEIIITNYIINNVGTLGYLYGKIKMNTWLTLYEKIKSG